MLFTVCMQYLNVRQITDFGREYLPIIYNCVTEKVLERNGKED